MRRIMKKILPLLLVSLVSGYILLYPFALPVRASSELLNPSFEDKAGRTCSFSGSNVLQHWRGRRQGLWGIGLFCQADYAVDGDHSAAMLGLGGGTGYWDNKSSPIDVVPGSSGRFEFWVVAGFFLGVNARVEVWSKRGSEQLIAQSAEIHNTGGWQAVSVDYTVPTGVDQIYLKLKLDFLGIGVAFWDSFVMTAYTTPTPSPTLGVSPTPTLLPTATPTPLPTPTPTPISGGTFDAWWQVENGTVQSGGVIQSTAVAPTGFNTSGELIAKSGIVNTSSSQGWHVENYASTLSGATQLTEILPRYNDLKLVAVEFQPTDKLPHEDGIYRVVGNYELDGDTQAAWKNATVSAIYIVEGNLLIPHTYKLSEDNHSIFLVEGNVDVNGGVLDMGGVFILEGTFRSNADSTGNKQLVVDGSVVALQGLNLTRDLGDQGAVRNETEPAEKFVLPIRYLIDSELVQLYSGGEYNFKWQEAAP